MFEIRGKYATAKVFNDYVEPEAIGQIQQIVSSKAFDGQKISIMPDVHSGKGICIGFVGTLGDYVNPEHVGQDVGCMVSLVEYDKPLPVDKYAEFNHKVLSKIGFGHDMSPIKAYSDRDLCDYLTKACNRAKSAHPTLFYGLPDKVTQEWITKLCKRLNLSEKTFYSSINSVGSGNHYLEYGEGIQNLMAVDYETAGLDGISYPGFTEKTIPHYGVSVHCGSRNFGLKVCNYWKNFADGKISKNRIKELTKEFKDSYLDNHDSMINFKTDLDEYIKEETKDIIPGYLNGEYMHGYLCDMVIAIAYAEFNHMIIHKTIEMIMKGYGLRPVRKIYTKHNYIDFDTAVPVIRKGAIGSYEGQLMLVPFNMRDGIAICEGKSNDDWLCSCCHGAGRKMSRSKAKETLSMDEFKETMKDVYSTTITNDTLDESPMAYKDTNEIKEYIKDTCEIKYMIIPKINIKYSKAD